MPHVIIEYSENLSRDPNIGNLSRCVHYALNDSGLFALDDIKTRAYSVEDYLVGSVGDTGAFLHVMIYLLEGRSIQQRKALSESVCNAVSSLISSKAQVSVDVRELSKEIYSKRVLD